MSRTSIITIVVIIMLINFFIRSAAVNKKKKSSTTSYDRPRPYSPHSRGKKPRRSSPTGRVSDVEKEFLRDHEFNGTYSQDGSSFIPSPEIEDPKDSKTFYVILLGIVVVAVAVLLFYYLY